jgi:hypothetical protein
MTWSVGAFAFGRRGTGREFSAASLRVAIIIFRIATAAGACSAALNIAGTSLGALATV